jgi:GTPase SAR1 family protein
MSSSITHDLLILGSSGSGKTSFITKATSQLLDFPDTIDFNPIDTNGAEDHPHRILAHPALHTAKAVIVIFDLTDTSSFTQAVAYCNVAKAMYSELPVVLVGNKTDLTTVKRVPIVDISHQLLTWSVQAIPIMYYNISVMTGQDFEKPLIHLASLMGDADLLP